MVISHKQQSAPADPDYEPWQTEMVNAVERYLTEISVEDYPDEIMDAASDILQEAITQDLMRGHSYQCLFAAALYIGCASLGIPIRFGEMAQLFEISEKRMRGALNAIRQLDYRIFPDYGAFLERYCRQLGVFYLVYDVKTVFLATRRLCIGKDPHSHVGGCIYYIGTLQEEGGPTQKEVATVTGVSVVTVRNRYRELRTFYLPRHTP